MNTPGILLLLAVFVAEGIVAGSFSGRKYLSGGYWDQPYSKPYFENSTKREVTTTVGQTAHLHCRVRNLGDRAVSWIRKRDLHILTVGILTYTGDQRFQSLHSDGTDEWTLKVTSSQMRDSGTYECQVSTEPKISMAFQLNVVVSQAEILGNPELHLKSGSDINLTCIVRQTPEPPTYIYWYHGQRVINYSQRGGINVVTEKQTRTSRLLISKAQPSDSGNYTCAPSNSESASMLVHVLNGEHPAAMQHGNNLGWRNKPDSLSTPGYFVILFLIYFYISRWLLLTPRHFHLNPNHHHPHHHHNHLEKRRRNIVEEKCNRNNNIKQNQLRKINCKDPYQENQILSPLFSTSSICSRRKEDYRTEMMTVTQKSGSGIGAR